MKKKLIKTVFSVVFSLVLVSSSGVFLPSVSATDVSLITEAPGAPLNFKVKKLAADDDHYLLTWNSPTTGGTPEYYIIQSFAMYDIEEGAKRRDFDEIHYTGNVYPMSLATNVIRLVAANSAGKSEGSNTVVLDDLIGTTPEYCPIAVKPTIEAGDAVVTLKWTPDILSNWGKPDYYEILRMAPGEPDLRAIGFVAYEDGNSSYQWIDNAVENEQTYTYQVRAVNYLGHDSRLDNVRYLDATPSTTDPRVSEGGTSDVQEPNTLDALGKTVLVSYSKLKKKTQVIKLSKTIKFYDKGQGKISYKKKNGNKKIAVNRTTGALTVKKGLKKGTYKLKMIITAAGDDEHEVGTRVVTIKIKVK